MTRALPLAALVLFSLLTLGGCSGSSEPSKPATPASKPPAAAAAAESAAKSTPTAAPVEKAKAAVEELGDDLDDLKETAAEKIADAGGLRPVPVEKPAAAAPGQDTAAPVQPKPRTPKPEEGPYAYVLMKTSLGEMVFELDREKAPITVANVLRYVDKQFYNDTVFHRIMANFMVQGGGFDLDNRKKPTDPPIENEWRNGLKNKRGTLAMARIGGRPDSATSQFFINVVDNAFLDQPQADGAAYAVFGRVYAGMDVVETIRKVEVKRSARGEPSEPVEPVVIVEARQITPQQAMKRAELEKQLKGTG